MQADRDRLYYYINDYNIFQYYIGDFEIGDVMNSPLREDNTPSFQIKLSSSNRLYWVDYGIDQDNYDGVELVSLMYGLSRDDAVEKIWGDLILKEGVNLNPIPVREKVFKVPYEFEYKEMNDIEYSYWSKLGITRELLEEYNVKALKGLYRLDVKLLESTDEMPVYIYLFDDPLAFKSYQPNGGIWKWRGQANGNLIEGWDQLKEQDTILFITSSLKDTLVMRTMGYSACNPTSENSYSNIVDKRDEINRRFNKVYIFFDTDTPGIKASKNMAEKTGWVSIGLPYSWNAKDPSDLITNDQGSYKRLELFLKKIL